MSMDKIAILGASKPHLKLYTKAKEMGLETYCLAWADGAFCKDYADHYYDVSIIDKEKVTDICRKEKINGIVSNALEPAVPTAAYVSKQLHLNGLTYEAALRARNKLLMRQAIEDANACLQPRFSLFKQDDVQSIHFPVIIKPTDGSGSNGVTKVNIPEQFQAAIKRASSASGNCEILIEEYIEGQEISVEAISFHGKHYILTITDKETTGAPYFVETAHHQPSALNDMMQQRIKEYTEQILMALNIDNAASHTEFKINADGDIYFIEVGARGGGDFISYNLVELSTGYDFVKGMIDVALNRFEPPILQNNKYSYSGVYFLSKETAYVKEFIEKNKSSSWVKEYGIDDTPLKELKKSQDRSGYIIYQSNKKITI